MTIDKQWHGAALTLALVGRLDMATSPALEKALKASLDETENLVLDSSKLSYISSVGVRVLLMAQKAMSGKGGMKIQNVNEIVREVFDMTGFSGMLTIE